MNDRVKLGCRALSLSVIAALAVGTVATSSDAQTMQQQYSAPAQTRSAPPPQQPEQQSLPSAMRNSVAEYSTPCGGDFGMLGNLEAARHGVAQANPTGAPVCD
jgi:hypothetical protein